MVFVIFEDVEIYRTVAFVRISGIEDLLDEVYLFDARGSIEGGATLSMRIAS